MNFPWYSQGYYMQIIHSVVLFYANCNVLYVSNKINTESSNNVGKGPNGAVI